jgi:hypothetical protein
MKNASPLADRMLNEKKLVSKGQEDFSLGDVVFSEAIEAPLHALHCSGATTRAMEAEPGTSRGVGQVASMTPKSARTKATS